MTILTTGNNLVYAMFQVIQNTLETAECPAPDSRGFFTSIVFRRTNGLDGIVRKAVRLAVSRFLNIQPTLNVIQNAFVGGLSVSNRSKPSCYAIPLRTSAPLHASPSQHRCKTHLITNPTKHTNNIHSLTRAGCTHLQPLVRKRKRPCVTFVYAAVLPTWLRVMVMCNSATTPQLSPQQIELIDQLDQGICALRGFIDLLDSADLREIKSGDLYALGLPILLQFQQAKQNIKGTQHA